MVRIVNMVKRLFKIIFNNIVNFKHNANFVVFQPMLFKIFNN